MKTPGSWLSSATRRRPARTKSPGPSRTRPPSTTWPFSASSRPATTEQTVDLPEPLGPMSAVVRPASTSRSMTTSRSGSSKATCRSWPRPPSRGDSGIRSSPPWVETCAPRGSDAAASWSWCSWSPRRGSRREATLPQSILVAPTMTKDRPMSTAARAREVAVSFSRSR